MKRIVLLFTVAILLVGCGEKQVSPEVQARREFREVAKKKRDESREVVEWVEADYSNCNVKLLKPNDSSAVYSNLKG